MWSFLLTNFLLGLLGCQGLPSKRHQGKLKIVGGHKVSIEQFPYQVSMEYQNEQICGGSVLAPTWILTAGHCSDAVGHRPNYVTVRLGTATKELGGDVISAAAISPHPDFDISQYQYDVALIRLRSGVTYSAAIQPISIAEEGAAPPQGEWLTVSGWGALHSGDNDYPVDLYAVQVPVIGSPMCHIVYQDAHLYPIRNNSFCAGLVGKDACQADSGGPIVNKYGVQLGVVSWGKGCGDGGYPGVYANLAEKTVRDFIVSTAGL